MRKAIIGAGVLVALATAAASVWWLWQRGAGGASLLDELDASQTIAAVELRNLDELARQGWKSLEQMPKDALPEPLQRAGLAARLGGDPGEATAWQGWGLDPALGVAVVADRRLVSAEQRTPLPVLLARVTDRAKLQAALARAGVTVTLGKQVGDIQEVSVEGQALWLGGSGERLALMQAPGAATPQEQAIIRAGFEAFLRPAATALRQHAGFAKVRREAGDRHLLAWVDTAAAAGLQGDKELAADVTFFAGLFPYQSAWFGKDSAWRVGASEAGRQALAEVVKPKRNPPRCARLLPKTGWAGARLSVNLIDLMQGVGKLLPPSTPPSARTALPAATAMLAFTGVGWGEITEAFSGHLCGGVDMASALGMVSSRGQSLPTWVAAVGVVDAPKADALLAKLVQLASGKGGLKATEVAIDGKKAWQLSSGALTVVVARLDDAILIAPSATVLQAAAARAKDQSLAATPLAEALDGDVVVSAVADLLPVADAIKALAAGGADAARSAEVLATWSQALKDKRYFGMSLHLDGDGLLLHNVGDAALPPALLGAMPWLAGATLPFASGPAPQIRKVDGLDEPAQRELRRAAERVLQWYGEAHADAPACQFPPSAGPNPPQSCCSAAMDADQDQRCDLGSWQSGATWTALGLPPAAPSPYRYALESSGSLGEARFTLTLYADVDCDGREESAQLSGRGQVAADGACSAVLDGP